MLPLITASKDRAQLDLFSEQNAARARNLRRILRRPSVCPICDGADPFDPDNEFVDESGFVTACCGSNLFYVDLDKEDT